MAMVQEMTADPFDIPSAYEERITFGEDSTEDGFTGLERNIRRHYQPILFDGQKIGTLITLEFVGGGANDLLALLMPLRYLFEVELPSGHKARFPTLRAAIARYMKEAWGGER